MPGRISFFPGEPALPLERAAAFCGAGWFLDKWLGTAPWLLVVAILIGSALGLYEFVRLSSKTY